MNTDFWSKVAEQWQLLSGVHLNNIGNVDVAVQKAKQVAETHSQLIALMTEEEDFLNMDLEDDW